MIKRLIIVLLFSLNIHCAEQQKKESPQVYLVQIMNVFFKSISDKLNAEITNSVGLLCNFLLKNNTKLNKDNIVSSITILAYSKFCHLVKDVNQQSQFYEFIYNLTSIYFDIFYKAELMFSKEAPDIDDAIKTIHSYTESLESYKTHDEYTQNSLKIFSKQEIERRVKDNIAQMEDN